jgi:hypothetical protein
MSGPQEQIQNAIHPSDSLSLANMISQFALPGPGGEFAVHVWALDIEELWWLAAWIAIGVFVR